MLYVCIVSSIYINATSCLVDNHFYLRTNWGSVHPPLPPPRFDSQLTIRLLYTSIFTTFLIRTPSNPEQTQRLVSSKGSTQFDERAELASVTPSMNGVHVVPCRMVASHLPATAFWNAVRNTLRDLMLFVGHPEQWIINLVTTGG